MSMQAISNKALGPAAKGLYAGSGLANGLPGASVPQQAAEADARSEKRSLEIRQKEVAAKLPAATQLQFSPDPEHNRVFIRVSDAQTGRVLIEIPSEKVVRAIDQLLEIATGPRIDFEA